MRRPPRPPLPLFSAPPAATPVRRSVGVAVGMGLVLTALAAPSSAGRAALTDVVPPDGHVAPPCEQPVVSAPPEGAPPASVTVTCTYDFLGEAETWTVPAGVTSARFSVSGAQGAVYQDGGGGGDARGAQVITTVGTLVAGTSYEVRVGGSGELDRVLDPGHQTAPFNGGGLDPLFGLDGGGASDIRPAGGDLGSRMVVAGGGGANGYWDSSGSGTDGEYYWARGGDGGGAGEDGQSGNALGGTQSGSPGRAGGATAGGAGGAGADPFQFVDPGRGEAGTFGVGGSPALLATRVSEDTRYPETRAPGGAGGGGWWGGGAGGAGDTPETPRGNPQICDGSFNVSCIGTGGGGGGGGSSYVSSSLESSGTTVTDGARAGHGLVVISWTELQPTVSVSSAESQDALASDPTARFSVVFSEPVTGFGTEDLVLGGTAARGPASVSGSGAVYEVAVGPQTSDGTVSLGVAAGAANDGSSVPTSASDAPASVTYDGTAPGVVVSLASGQPSTSDASTAFFRATFTEPVADLGADDVDTSQGTAPGAQVSVQRAGSSGNAFDVTVSTTGAGTIVVTIPAGATTDRAGNPSTAAAEPAVVTRTAIETGPLTATIDQAPGQADPTTLSTVVFRTVFSRAVIGFEASDVVLDGSAVGAGTAVEVSPFGDGRTSFNVTVSGLEAPGTVSAALPEAAASADSDQEPSQAATSTDATVTLEVAGPPDTSGPSVSLDQAPDQADPTTATTVVFRAVFSEPVFGVDVSKVDLAGGTAPGAEVAGVVAVDPDADDTTATTYDVSVRVTGPGTVRAALLPGAAVDFAENPSGASTSTDAVVTVAEPPDDTPFIDGDPPSFDTTTWQSQPITAELLTFVMTFGRSVTIDPDRAALELAAQQTFERFLLTVRSSSARRAPDEPARRVALTGTAFVFTVEGLRGPPGEVRVRIPAGAIVDGDGRPFPEFLSPTYFFPGSDLVAPETSMVGGPLEETFLAQDSVSYELGSDDPDATFDCAVDGVEEPCGSGVLAVELSPGEHVLTAAARDLAGNVDATPAIRRVVVPLDDTAWQVGRGFVRRQGDLAYQGTYSVAREHRSVLTAELEDVEQLAVLATTGPGRGRLRVVLDGEQVGVLRLERETRTLRDVLVLPALDDATSGTVRLVSVGRGPVRIDGVGVRTAG